MADINVKPETPNVQRADLQKYARSMLQEKKNRNKRHLSNKKAIFADV
jgi:hypothetical protein